jgi:hypothetical protein
MKVYRRLLRFLFREFHDMRVCVYTLHLCRKEFTTNLEIPSGQLLQALTTEN